MKGVVITWETSPEESDKIERGLGRLRRRRTKTTIPIIEHMTAAPPMIPPTIAAVFDFVCDDESFFVTVPFGLMLSTGALRDGPGQS